MSNSLCFTPLSSFKPINKQGLATMGSCNVRKVQWMSDVTRSSKDANLQSLEIKAADSSPSTKPNSIVCTQCEGNGCIQCKHCKGTGVNSVDHFNGQFKAGGLCWLCRYLVKLGIFRSAIFLFEPPPRGKKEILCGQCNGAGFLGGILSTMED